jgi:hypothetical protein
MALLPRSFLPVAAVAAVLTGLVTGCASAGGASADRSQPQSRSVSVSVSAAGVSPSQYSAVVPVSGSPAGAGAPSGQVVYLAESEDVGGPKWHAPACKTGCLLSGDDTAALWDMTWSAWNGTVAVGAGTEKLDDCTPNCARGTLHAVPVVVVLSKPVMVCVSGKGTWFWTRASFTWPAGLPAFFTGGNAPANPWDFSDITAQSVKACG